MRHQFVPEAETGGAVYVIGIRYHGAKCSMKGCRRQKARAWGMYKCLALRKWQAFDYLAGVFAVVWRGIFALGSVMVKTLPASTVLSTSSVPF